MGNERQKVERTRGESSRGEEINTESVLLPDSQYIVSTHSSS